MLLEAVEHQLDRGLGRVREQAQRESLDAGAELAAEAAADETDARLRGESPREISAELSTNAMKAPR